MEDELRCPACKQFVTRPVLLPCAHSYCLQCALTCQVPVGSGGHAALHGGILSSGQQPSPCSSTSAHPTTDTAHSTTGSDTASVCVSDHDAESDKLSVLSETDSGVVVCTNSRPNSFLGGNLNLIGNLNLNFAPASYRGILTPPPSGAFALICAACHKPAYFPDDQGPHFLPKNTALANVVQRYISNLSYSTLYRLNSLKKHLIF